jgi:hypothetical protein
MFKYLKNWGNSMQFVSYKKLILLVLCAWISPLISVDFVIFSYDRPIQLYALLESSQLYIKGITQTYVIYRVSSEEYEQGYQRVMSDFPYVEFHRQGENPTQDFKPLTIDVAFGSSSEYIMFGVDDIIVKNYVDLAECISALESTHAYAFYLRLGAHLTCSYPAWQKQKVPPFTVVNDKMMLWQFSSGEMNWKYPNTVDMTIYRKSDIQEELMRIDYTSPNTLEYNWFCGAPRVMNNMGLCFYDSIIINVPINRVQSFCPTPHMNLYSPKQLLEIFVSGSKIDIKPLFKIKNNGCHMDYKPSFIAI